MPEFNPAPAPQRRAPISPQTTDGPRSSRRTWLGALGVGAVLPSTSGRRDEADDVRAAQRLAGLAFTDQEIAQATPLVTTQRAAFAALRSFAVDRFTDPAFQFDPWPAGLVRPPREGPSPYSFVTVTEQVPTDLDLAFASIGELGAWLRAGRVTARRLTELSLQRLARLDAALKCVVTLLREHALAAADRADRELAAGQPRGPLHGIPFGAKDLLAHPAGPTTFGAEPFRDQHLDLTATVLERLERQGAVLVAKLSLGALAMGDRWFGGMTRNPWNPEQGSSGSSAGSAAATAAGLVPFALGSETLGSIVSPAARCSVTALRPTFGAVPRTGAMALSWTMDKLGVLARHADDCALVFDAIRGTDGRDLMTRDAGFPFDSLLPLRGLRVGLLRTGASDVSEGPARDFVAFLRDQGVATAPVEWPKFPYSALRVILEVEAATAFDELTRDGGVRALADQSDRAWPNLFRAARFVPAVEYLRASRVRTDLMRAVAQVFADFDAILTPTHTGETLLCTNLTGHPALALPVAAGERQPRLATLIGPLFGEAFILRLASAWQRATTHHRQRPALATRGD